MYKTPKESLAFLDAFLPLVETHDRDEILVLPTMSSLAYVLDALVGNPVSAGAQNMHWLNEGPYTGQTSPTMLVSIGCRHVLLGHSEQRLYFNETYERVNLKLKAAINHGIRDRLRGRTYWPNAKTARPKKPCAHRCAPPCATFRRTRHAGW